MTKSQISLPNGCRCSQLTVIPKNWKQAKKITGTWLITYRFYDPAHPKPRQVNIKAMNRFSDVGERRSATVMLLQEAEAQLRSGYNPFHKKIIIKQGGKYNIEPTTLFIDALKGALERIDIEPRTRQSIKGYIIPNIEKAAIALSYHLLYVSEVKRRHIVFMLDHLRQVNEGFTDNTFNHFRKYLSILFEELLLIDAVEFNIIRSIPKKQVEVKPREVLTQKQRDFVNKLLQEKYPSFHRFLHIFFHSGARISELLRLKGSDVDLTGQRFRTTIKKGRKERTTWRPIKDIALPFWTNAMQCAGADDYVFSKGLLPGDKSIRPDQITKRWYRLVKGKDLGITADFYSLKHSNTTEMVNHLDEEAAAQLNEHTSTAMVVKIYDTKNKDRKDEKIKKVNNPFA